MTKMKQPTALRRRQTARVVPPPRTLPPSNPMEEPITTSGRFTALLERASNDILAVTYWFEPVPHPHPYSVTIMFTGHRVGTEGKAQAKDQFVHFETIDDVIPGSGPITITANISDITPGEWAVIAQIQPAAHIGRRASKDQALAVPLSPPTLRYPLNRFWRWWAPSVASPAEADAPPSKTCLQPFARTPGIFPFAWILFVVSGFLLALAIQSLVIARDHLALRQVGLVEFAAIVAGIVGAKLWFVVKHRSEHGWVGWCIQGFNTGAIVAVVIMLLVNHLPVGVFLDVTAPSLLMGMAVGRIGCFFGGCCGGPPTASRWGVWSSDQRIGARRVPTQLIETALAASLGLGSLVAVLRHGPFGGALFVAAIAAYTLGRQGILHLRAEPSQSPLGDRITVGLALLTLIVAGTFLMMHIQ